MILEVAQKIFEVVVVLAIGLPLISWWQSRKHAKFFGTPRFSDDSK